MEKLSIQSKTIQVDVPSNSYKNNSFTHISELSQKEINFPNTGKDFGLTKEYKTIQDEIPQEEIWKTHDEYPNYVFSSFGRVYSYKKSLRGNLISGWKDHGYIRIGINDSNNELVKPFLNRIIYEIFGDESEALIHQEVDHIRRDEKTNNNINNLRLADRKENCANKGKIQKNRLGNKPSSSYVGISKRQSGNWQTTIIIRKKTFNLGTYKNAKNGAYVYSVVAKQFKPPIHWNNTLPINFQLPNETENRDQVIVNKINEIKNWLNQH